MIMYKRTTHITCNHIHTTTTKQSHDNNNNDIRSVSDMLQPAISDPRIVYLLFVKAIYIYKYVCVSIYIYIYIYIIICCLTHIQHNM